MGAEWQRKGKEAVPQVCEKPLQRAESCAESGHGCGADRPQPRGAGEAATKLPLIEQKEVRVLAKTEIAPFVEAIKGNKLERMYWVGLFTGLRQSELIGLTWACVDFEAGTLRVYRQNQKLNKGYAFDTPKQERQGANARAARRRCAGVARGQEAAGGVTAESGRGVTE